MARKPTDTVQFKLRFDEGLRRKVEKSAKERGVSINTEIIDRLEGSFTLRERWQAAWERDRKTWLSTLRLFQKIDPENAAKIAAEIDDIAEAWEKSPVGTGL
jgi:hypothetical protein